MSDHDAEFAFVCAFCEALGWPAADRFELAGSGTPPIYGYESKGTESICLQFGTLPSLFVCVHAIEDHGLWTGSTRLNVQNAPEVEAAAHFDRLAWSHFKTAADRAAYAELFPQRAGWTWDRYDKCTVEQSFEL